jgi:hypothetical protein
VEDVQVVRMQSLKKSSINIGYDRMSTTINVDAMHCPGLRVKLRHIWSEDEKVYYDDALHGHGCCVHGR